MIRSGLATIAFALLLAMPAAAADIEDYKRVLLDADQAGLRALLKADAGRSPPRTDSGKTVLHVAASSFTWRERAGSVAIVLAAGADPNATDREGFTPLHEAAIAGCGECVVALLKAGSDPKAVDHRGVTPLHRAAASGCDDCASALLAAGADASARAEGGRSPLLRSKRTTRVLLLAAGADLQERDDDGRTALHLSWETDPGLLALGVNVTDRYGFTPLHYAALDGAEERIDWLLAHGADPALASTAAYSNRKEVDLKDFSVDVLEFPAGQRAYDLARYRHDQTKWSTGKYRGSLERLDKATPRRGWFGR